MTKAGKTLSQQIHLTGRIGMIVSILFVISIMDMFIAGFRQPRDEFHLLPGSRIPVNGKIDAKLQTTKDVVFVSESAGLSIEFAAARGNLWRGHLQASGNLQPGEYTFMVLSRGIAVTPKTHRYRVWVHPDVEDMRHSDKSLILRWLGFPPFWGIVITLPVIILLFGVSYFLSVKKDRLNAQEGKSEIIKLKKEGDSWEITFGLGLNHGIQKGDILLVQDLDDTVYGIAEVTEVFAEYATGRVSNLEKLSPTFIVKRRDKPSTPPVA